MNLKFPIETRERFGMVRNSMPRYKAVASKPRLPAKTLKLLNAYRDAVVDTERCRARGLPNFTDIFCPIERKARRELVKHLLKP